MRIRHTHKKHIFILILLFVVILLITHIYSMQRELRKIQIQERLEEITIEDVSSQMSISIFQQL